VCVCVLQVQNFLHYFKSEDQAADVAEGGVIDLGDVDEVRKAENKGIEIVTESRLWQLRADSANTQDIWYNKLISVCQGGSGQGMMHPDVSDGSGPSVAAKDATSLAKADLKLQVRERELRAAAAAPHRQHHTTITTTTTTTTTTTLLLTSPLSLMPQVPGADGQPSWKSASFELWSDALLRWSSSEPWPWDAGTIDVSKAKGVWLLGPPGWRRLDIILPEHRWTLAADGADGDETLQKWIKLLEGLAPEKPVSEIRNGWMEKKGAVNMRLHPPTASQHSKHATL